jgi:hypothetical protein
MRAYTFAYRYPLQLLLWLSLPLQAFAFLNNNNIRGGAHIQGGPHLGTGVNVGGVDSTSPTFAWSGTGNMFGHGQSCMRIAMTPPNTNNNDSTNDGNGNGNTNNPVDTNTSILNRRLHKMRAKIYEQQITLPPNPNLTPTQIVTSILTQLNTKNSNHFTMPQSGFRTLIRASSSEWKEALRRSIGVPKDLDDAITEDTLISALASAMSRPNNQYQILVQEQDDQDQADTSMDMDMDIPSYALYFPGDVVDYLDGKCWLEAQLRDPASGRLLVILGWSLVQNDRREWLIDRIDWQDFRDEFRPGIGREEWMRICG